MLRQLNYKAAWAGRDFVQIDQFFPNSKRCFECGHVMDSLPLNLRDWHCPSCQSHNDREINAAKNIKAVGHRVLAFGENISLDKLSA